MLLLAMKRCELEPLCFFFAGGSGVFGSGGLRRWMRLLRLRSRAPRSPSLLLLHRPPVALPPLSPLLKSAPALQLVLTDSLLLMLMMLFH